MSRLFVTVFGGVVLVSATGLYIFGHTEHQLDPERIRRGEIARFMLPAPSAPWPAPETVAVLEDGRRLGPEVETSAEVESHRRGAFALELTGGSGLERVGVLVFTASDGTEPRSNGRRYLVRYQNRQIAAFAAIVVFLWVVIPWGLFRIWGRGWAPIQASGSGGRLAVVCVVLSGMAYSLFAVQAWLPRSNATWLSFVFVVGLVPVAVRRRDATARWPVWAVWSLGLLAWAGWSIALGGAQVQASGFFPFALMTVAGVGTYLGVRWCLCGPSEAGIWVFAWLLAFAGGLSLLRDGGVDFPRILGSELSGPVWQWGLANLWTAKFVAHWVLVVALCTVAAVARSTEHRAIRSLSIALASTILVAVNGSKTALGATVISLTIFTVATRLPRISRRVLVGVAICGVVLFPLIASIPWSVHRSLGPSARENGVRGAVEVDIRGGIWEFSRRIISKQPIAGLGFGVGSTLPGRTIAMVEALGAETDSVSPARRNTPALPDGHPHNAALQIWMDLGLIGALLAAGLVWAIGRAIARVEENRLQHAALLGLLTVNATYLAFNYPLWEPEVLSILWMSAALASTVLPKPEVSRRELVRNAIAVGVILVIGCSVLAAEKASRRLVARDLREGTVLQLAEGTVRDDGKTWTLNFDSDLDAGARVVQPEGVDRPLIQGWAYAPGRGEPDHVVVFVGSEPVEVVWPERPTEDVFLRTEDRDVRALTAGFVFWSKDEWLAHDAPVTIVATYGDEHLAVSLPPLSALGSDAA